MLMGLELSHAALSFALLLQPGQRRRGTFQQLCCPLATADSAWLRPCSSHALPGQASKKVPRKGENKPTAGLFHNLHGKVNLEMGKEK